MSEENEEWLTSREAAKFLGGISEATVKRKAANNEIPGYKITERQWKFKKSELERYLESRRNDAKRD